MTFNERMLVLQDRMKSAQDDDTRYQVAETIRDLGYIDFRDFCGAVPVAAHIDAVENILRAQA
jgi:hypothetical protein